jgi:hypothetical protein
MSKRKKVSKKKGLTKKGKLKKGFHYTKSGTLVKAKKKGK